MLGRFRAAGRHTGTGARSAKSPRLQMLSSCPETGPAAGRAGSIDQSVACEKLLDAKVRLHRRLIEEINLSAIEKLPKRKFAVRSRRSYRNTSWPNVSR